METKEQNHADEIVEIEAGRYTLDWTDYRKFKIVVKDTMGLILHFRGDLGFWHVEVKTKQKIHRCNKKGCIWGKDYHSYELDHWVNQSEVVRIIKGNKLKILRIVNTHSSNNFTKQLTTLFAAVNQNT